MTRTGAYCTPSSHLTPRPPWQLCQGGRGLGHEGGLQAAHLLRQRRQHRSGHFVRWSLDTPAMEPRQVAEAIRERLGMELQALSLVRGGWPDWQTPRVWTVMTEHGRFWAVEGTHDVELFRAVPSRALRSNPSDCASPAEALRHYLALHPQAADSPASDAAERESYTCRNCGVGVGARRRSERTSRQLCRRCYHAECERVRYQNDADYRARRLAYSAARYRQSHQRGE